LYKIYYSLLNLHHYYFYGLIYVLNICQGKRKLNILDSEDSNSSIHEPEAEEAKGGIHPQFYMLYSGTLQSVELEDDF